MWINNLKILLRHSVIKTLNYPQPMGLLSVIPTPIGNMNDLTPNIIKRLFQADLIGCQDRRVAGQLYKLIKNKKIIQEIIEKFGSIGLSDIIEISQQQIEEPSNEFRLYQYMNEKQRRKFLRKFTTEEQKKFKIDYLNYRATKVLNRHRQYKIRDSQFKNDQLYGIQNSDFGSIETQIKKTRAKKGRGVLIPLNTYSQTKMFDLVRMLVQTRKVAIVTDAGMPCISDPGWRMVDHIRTKMPRIPIQVVGGPSSVTIMSMLATLSSSNSSLSGRFEGFASAQVSRIAEDKIVLNDEQIVSKKKDFSIHFINSKKLKKHILHLQKIYGENQNIIITSELTKKFQRKYHGTLKQLNKILTQNDTLFQQGGEMSFILYPQNIINEKQQKTKNTKLEIVTIQASKLANCLSSTLLSNKQKVNLMSTILGLKSSEAKDYVYKNLTSKKQ